LPRDRAADQFRAAAMIGLLMGGDPQQVQRVGMSGVNANDLLIEGFRLIELTRFVVFHGLLKRF
jgi:hypothetical protein